ncbi:MAG TPA: pseudaminic acid synthase [Steroidobacteraceae bacterium]
MTERIHVGNRTIGKESPPFIVAEMSGNHNHSFERAIAIVEAAAAAGAHAIKLQTYTADTMTLPISEGEFFIRDEKSLWKGSSLHELYKRAHTPWDWHAPIMRRAAELGILCFSTPFDDTAVDFLEGLGAPAYKIASFEIVHLPLIRRVAATGKPVFVSTGMATLAEIRDAVDAAREGGCRDLILFKCTSNYPAHPENSNVLTIPALRERFGCEVGLSDHTLGIGAAIAAVAHGATAIEKHFTIRRADGGVDSAFSMEPEEMHSLVVETTSAWQSLGGVRFGPSTEEEPSLVYRRSLYVAEDMRAGDVFTSKNLRIIRPGLGLAPKHYEALLGRPVVHAVQRGTPVTWELVGEAEPCVR